VNFDVKEADNYNAVIQATSLSTFMWETYAFNFKDNDTVVVDSSKTTPMTDVTVDDNLYHSRTDYLGMKSTFWASGLRQQFYFLDKLSTFRMIPTADLSAIGGLIKHSADFEQTNSSTGEVDTVTFKQSHIMVPDPVEFTYTVPAYIDTNNDVSATDDTNGYKLGINYNFGVAPFVQYKATTRAETEDSANSTQYKFSYTDYRISGQIDATWHDDFLDSPAVSSTGVKNFLALSSNMTKIGLYAAIDPETARNNDMKPNVTANDRNNEYTLRVIHKF
jgi:hypothetical protein